MDSSLMGELLSRIDERTKNMESRQIEEIEKRESLAVRVASLETWRNYLVGAHSAVVAALSAVGIYVKAHK